MANAIYSKGSQRAQVVIPIGGGGTLDTGGLAMPSYDAMDLQYDAKDNLIHVDYFAKGKQVGSMDLTYDGSDNLIHVTVTNLSETKGLVG